jgi:hypothetical protein
MTSFQLTGVEAVKAASDQLRGTIAAELRKDTVRFSDDAGHILKCTSPTGTVRGDRRPTSAVAPAPGDRRPSDGVGSMRRRRRVGWALGRVEDRRDVAAG